MGLHARVAFILASVSMGLASAVSAHGQGPAGHGLAVRQRTCVPGECICTGQVEVRARLNETGPTANELRRGARCIVADFDGNGAVDYALPGGEGFVTVILSTPGGGFLRAVRLDAGGMIHLYAPRSTPEGHGEPLATLPGLFVPWVGQSHAVFLWDGDGFARTVVAQERAPQVLLIVQERLKPNSLRAYDRAERDIANQCTRLKCPHPYLALESLTGPKEVWWLNAFASAGDKERVERAYKGNEALMAELRRLSQRKSALTHEPVEIVATYRGDLSHDHPWSLNGSRFFVITVGSEERKSDGSVFEAPDGRRFVFTSATTRREADQKAALAGSHARVFAIHPLWSYPADGWVAADPEFWRGSPLARSRPRGSG